MTRTGRKDGGMSETGAELQVEPLGHAVEELPAELPTELPPVPMLATPDEFDSAELTPADSSHSSPGALEEPPVAPDPLLGVNAQLEALAREVAGFNERSASREALLNRAHDEIERLREGDRRALLQPLLREVAALRNDLLMQSRSLPAAYSAEQAAKLLESFAGSVEQTLERFGIETFAPAIGDDLNFREYRRVGTLPTEDEALHGKVSAVRCDGYRDLELDRQLAHAEVLVFELKQEPATPVSGPTILVPPPELGTSDQIGVV